MKKEDRLKVVKSPSPEDDVYVLSKDHTEMFWTDNALDAEQLEEELQSSETKTPQLEE